MFDKIKKWIKNNKGFVIIIVLALILIVVLALILVSLLKSNSSNKYGNRLDGIEEVVIKKEVYDGVKEEVMTNEEVEEVTTRLQGKIVYTTITLKPETDVAKAKEIAAATLDNYTEEQLKYYDFSYFLKWNKEEGIVVITGNKHHSLNTITWIKG